MDRPEPPAAALLAAYAEVLDGTSTPFTVPGHKRRGHRLDSSLGRATDGDVPLFAGLDSMKLDGRRLEHAERLAAELWGADWCRFGTGGSSQANHALMLGLAGRGDTVLVARGVHRSVVDGLALSGLRPIWLAGQVERGRGLPCGPGVDGVASALDRHPRVAAVWLSEPGYLGTVSDVAGIADLAHDRGVPVVVDQAWGAHLGFHPSYPPHAIAAGADAMVVSAHKTLPAVSQASMLFARTERLDVDRLQVGFDLTNTTSPAGAILASIDGSRALLARDGPARLARLAELVAQTRCRIEAARPGLLAPGPGDVVGVRFDPAKLVLQPGGAGLDGVEIGAALAERGITLEMAERDALVAMVTIADDEGTLETLATALIDATADATVSPPRTPAVPSWYLPPEVVLTPREAMFAAAEAVASADAVGRVAAELIALYPPGVPALVPGERVSEELPGELWAARRAGARVAYSADPELATLRVVAR